MAQLLLDYWEQFLLDRKVFSIYGWKHQNIDNIPNDNSSLAADDGRSSLAEVGRATDSDGAVDAPDSEVDAIGSSTLGVELTGL